LKGRMIGIEGQLRQVPTLWSIGGTMLAINAGIVAVAGLAVALLRHAG
jgi:ABC-type Fe2+-enterobactin transport system substrate-binding protein